MIRTAATQGACVRSPTVASCRGATPSNDHAKMLRVQIMAMTKSSRAFQRMKLTPMITFSTVEPVMIPAKKLSTGDTGIPESSSEVDDRVREVLADDVVVAPEGEQVDGEGESERGEDHPRLRLRRLLHLAADVGRVREADVDPVADAAARGARP